MSNKVYFTQSAKVLSIITTIERDCKTLTGLIHKSQLLDQITERTDGAFVTITFSGADTGDICTGLNMVFKQEEIDTQLKALNLMVDTEIRAICALYPDRFFSLDVPAQPEKKES